MYSSIFACRVLSLSVCDRSSTTKSGHSGGNCSCSFSVNEFHRSLRTQLRSGARPARFGRMNSVDESKNRPPPSLLAQLPKATRSSAFCIPPFPPVGGIKNIFSSAVPLNRRFVIEKKKKKFLIFFFWNFKREKKDLERF